MIICINDIGKTSQEDTLALALSYNHLELLSLDIDWSKHPDEICKSLKAVKDNMIANGRRLDGFAGTGLGAVYALRMAIPPNQRWLAVDFPIKPRPYFEEKIKELKIEIEEETLKNTLEWYDVAEKHMRNRIAGFLNPHLKDPMNAGESILAMTEIDQEFKTWLWNNNFSYSLLTEANKFAELTSLLF